jgi:hypothetical protein
MTRLGSSPLAGCPVHEMRELRVGQRTWRYVRFPSSMRDDPAWNDPFIHRRNISALQFLRRRVKCGGVFVHSA